VVASQTVFGAFPFAEESGWSIGRASRGTERGTVWEELGEITPIVSDGTSGDFYTSPNASTVSCDLLLYVRPDQLPTANPNALLDYGVMSPDGEYFDVVQALIGRNQDNTSVEHIELMLQRSDALRSSDES